MTLPVVFTANGPSGYNLTKSLRFRSSASAYLNRTPASPSNRQTWTLSFWLKTSKSNFDYYIAEASTNSSTDRTPIAFNSGKLQIRHIDGSATQFTIETTQVFRDPSSWYHFVIAVDTTQATSTNRVKVYVNGSQITAFGTASYPTQNLNTDWNGANAHSIGSSTTPDSYADMYLTEFYNIDGQQLTPSSFGETSTTTGVWIPKKYTGTYGTNGFYLPFTDTTSTSTLGTDFSGNSNTWTVNNISLTSGSTYDSMNDVPTLTSATTANYAVMNPLSNSYSGTTVVSSITDGNLNFSDSSSNNRVAIGSMTSPSGKWYFEMTSSSTGTYAVGLMDKVSNAGSFYRNNGTYSSSFGGGGTSGYSSWTTGDVIGVAWDADAGKLWFAKNNTWQSGSPSSGTSPTNTFTAGLSLFADIYTDNSAGTKSGSFNFGQRPFSYTPPTNFVALNTFNLPTPTIGATAATTANKYMNIALYTGTGSSLSVTGVGFQPDWTWIKGRSGATDHGLYDAVRGVQKQLESNNTDAETTETTGLTAFGSDGFTVGALAQLNTSSATYVGWNWKANGAGSTNTAGSITSTVSANTTAGFSVVTYTGNATNDATIGHGLGVAPSMVITKNRGTSTFWYVYHGSLAATYNLYLNTTDAQQPDNVIRSTSATTFTVSSSSAANGTSMVAYCWAQIAGYSAFGSYTGNGSSDGTFVYTGFRPKFIIQKASSTTGQWMIFDTVRNTYNVLTNAELLANSSAAEGTGSWGIEMDILSNGFKFRGFDNSNFNYTGITYIYMAFAESPFKYANAR